MLISCTLLSLHILIPENGRCFFISLAVLYARNKELTATSPGTTKFVIVSINPRCGLFGLPPPPHDFPNAYGCI